MKKALVLAGGLPQIELINKLKDRGYYTILIDFTLHPVAECVADKFYRESTLDLEMVSKIAQDEHVDMIITCCTDQALNTVAHVAQELHLPCYITDEVGKAVTNKSYMKETFKEFDIPTADFIITTTPECNHSLKYPVVVKPVDCNSSKGVSKVYDDKHEYEAIKTSIAFSRTHTAIVEEFVDGHEVSVDAFVCKGIAKVLCVSFSEKIADKNSFVICRGMYPTLITENQYSKIETITQKIADAFGLYNSPMLIQMLVNNEGIYVIEFSARTGGCVKYKMIEYASGIDIIGSTIDLFEGSIPQVNPIRSEHYVVDEFIYCTEGEFSHLEGVEVCKEQGWAKDVFLLKSSGTMMGSPQSSGDRIAAIVIIADSMDDYIKKHNHIEKNIKVIDSLGRDIMRHDLFVIGSQV